MAWPDVVRDVAEALASLIAAVSLLLAYGQYRRSEQWKRKEFAQAQLLMLSQDPELRLAIAALDWPKRTLSVPERYRDLIRGRTFEHTADKLEKALRIYSNFNREEEMYRDVFDRLFEHLGRIEAALSLNLVDISDLVGLGYWTEQIANPRFIEGNKHVLLEFLKAYQYHRVLQLIDRFQAAAHRPGPKLSFPDSCLDLRRCAKVRVLSAVRRIERVERAVLVPEMMLGPESRFLRT